MPEKMPSKRMRITRLLLHNWMNFRCFALDYDVLLGTMYGVNGSGKTALQDAMSLVWAGEQENSLNWCGEERRSAFGAIHWWDGARFLRPNAVTAYIILEMADVNGDRFHQGLRMVSKDVSQAESRGKEGKKSVITYFMGEGRLEDIGAMDEETLDRNAVIMQDSSQVKLGMFRKFFARRGFSDAFIHPVSGGKDCVRMFTDLSRAILRNDGMNCTISEYARKNIFPPTEAGAGTLIEMETRLRELKRFIEDQQAKLAACDELTTAGKRFLKAQQELDLCARVAVPINLLAYDKQKQTAIQKKADADASAKACEAEKTSLQEQADVIGELVGRLQTPGQALQEAANALRASEADLLRLQERMERQEKYEAAVTFLEENNPDLATPEKFQEWSDMLDQELAELDAEIRQGKDEIAKLEVSLNAYRGKFSAGDEGNYNATMMRDAVRLKDMIADECPEAEPKLLYECVEDVLDPEWQAAAEGVVANARFGIVVPGPFYDKACSIQHRLKGNNRDVIVLNTKMLTAVPKTPYGQDSVATIFTYNDSYAEEYMHKMYGDVLLCETDEEYARARRAVRKNGQKKEPSRSVKPGAYRAVTPVFGRAAITLAIESLGQQIQKKELELASLTEERREIKQHNTRIEESMHVVNELADAYEPGLADKVAEAEARVQECREDVEAQSGTGAEQMRLQKLEEAKAQRAKVVEQQSAVMRQIAEYEQIAKKAEEEIKGADRQLTAILQEKEMREMLQWEDGQDPAEVLENLPARELDIIEKKQWETSLIGTLNIRKTLAELKQTIRDVNDMLGQAFRHHAQTLQRFPDPPMNITRQAHVDYFVDQAEAIEDAVVSDGNQEQLRNLEASIHQSYANKLSVMYREWCTASDIREQFNRYMRPYKIGASHYRLGEITVDPAAYNADIMRLAIDQGEGRMLTDEELEHVHARCMKDATEGTINSNLFDYRMCLQTRMEYKTDDMTVWKNANAAQAANSTGQQETLRYIVKIAVLACQAFTPRSVAYVQVDEAMKGMDDHNTMYFIDAVRQMQIQCTLSSYDPRFTTMVDRTYQMSKPGAYIRCRVFDAKPKKQEEDGQEDETAVLDKAV